MHGVGSRNKLTPSHARLYPGESMRPPEVTSTIALLPENIGGSQAENLSRSFAFLNCISLDVDEATLPALIDGDASSSIGVDVTPGPGCEGLTIVDWFLSYSGRETRGTFDVNVKALR